MVKLVSRKNRKPRKSVRKSNYNKKQARVLSKRVLNKRLSLRKKRLSLRKKGLSSRNKGNKGKKISSVKKSSQ